MGNFFLLLFDFCYICKLISGVYKYLVVYVEVLLWMLNSIYVVGFDFWCLVVKCMLVLCIGFVYKRLIYVLWSKFWNVWFIFCFFFYDVRFVDRRREKMRWVWEEENLVYKSLFIYILGLLYIIFIKWLKFFLKVFEVVLLI